MKILFLFPHFLLPGGAANSTTKFARGLQEKGYIVEILCANASVDFLTANSDLKISQLKIPNSNSFFYWALLPYWQIKINRTLARYPDYIFFPQVLPSNWWAWIFKLTHSKQKIVWNCNEPSAFIHSKKWIEAIQNPWMKIGAKIANPFLKYIDIKLEKQNNIVLCNSRFASKEYTKCYNRKADGIIYPPSLIEDIFLEKKENYIFTVSRLSKFKNVNLLIETFEKISATFPNYKLIIAGDGEEKNKLKKLAVVKKIENKIKFLGKISDAKLAKLYTKARVTVLCSQNEPFGLVPIESMMYGTPVIAHKSGGPLETIIENKTGFLYENKNDLFESMKKIVEMNSERYLEMQKASQLQANKFDISKSISQLEEILNKI